MIIYCVVGLFNSYFLAFKYQIKNLFGRKRLKLFIVIDMTEKQTVDPQLEDFILAETQKQRFQVLVHGLTDTCWDTCMGRPSTRMDSKTEVCIMNCVERFIDATTFITKRLMNTTKYRSDSPLEFQ